jgi:hypothetical protein
MDVLKNVLIFEAEFSSRKDVHDFDHIIAVDLSPE